MQISIKTAFTIDNGTGNTVENLEIVRGLAHGPHELSEVGFHEPPIYNLQQESSRALSLNGFIACTSTT